MKIIQYTPTTLHPSPASCPLQMFIPRSSLSYVFAITGGVFYASKFPENMFPGSASIALPCDCHMTTRVATCDCHMTTRVATCDCHMTTIGPECDCCVDCFLFSVLSLPPPPPRQGELLWLQPPLVACHGAAGLLVDTLHLGLRLPVLEDNVM